MKDCTRRTSLQLAAAALAAAALPAWAQSSSAPPLPKVGGTFALPSEIELIDGKTLHTQDWAGKVVVLEYWATTCPFCKRQLPHVQALYEKERRRGLEVLALSIDKKAADVPPVVKERGYTFPVAWMSKELARAIPKPPGLPVTIVIGRDGKVVLAESGEMFPEDIAAIAKFL